MKARLADDAVRDRAATETSRSLLVEASAGTGKTQTLVSRLAALLLADGVSLERIAAVTFTEKAAAEMKSRLRERLVAALAEPEPARERAAAALDALPGASISTIHALCARLLRDRPFDAAVSPSFAILDPVVARLLPRDLVRSFVLDEARNEGAAVTRALRAGADLDEVEAFAVELWEKRLFLDGAAFPSAPRTFGEDLVADLAGEVRERFFPRVDAEKHGTGQLEFDDLLLLVRGLVRRSAEARSAFRRSVPHLLVDEFQDTDPVQAEILVRLAAGEPQGEDWTTLAPRPGALFAVGDPKQSIYRFRRADVETYETVATLLPAGNRLALVTNFRSKPEIVAAANAISEVVLARPDGAAYEARHAPLEPGPPRDSWGPGPGTVAWLLPPSDVPDNADERRVSEGRAIARLLKARRGGTLARWGDAAILVPNNEHVDTLWQTLLEEGVPAAPEGGWSFYRREETAAVITALEAIDDPGDRVALAATLRSPLFGLSDLDLLEAVEPSGRFPDYRREAPTEALRAPFDLLRSLHRERHDRSVSETLLRLLEARHATLAALSGSVVNGVQAAANLERVLTLCHDLDARRESFKAAVAHLRTLLVDDAREAEPRAFEADEDAVHLMTVHKAKGLEFPTVVVAGLGFRNAVTVWRDRFRFEKPGGVWGAKLSVNGASTYSPGWEDFKKGLAARESAEARRLVYVGVTRAREHLVLSWFVNKVPKQAILHFLEPARAWKSAGTTPVERVVGDVGESPRPAAAVPETAVAVDAAAEISAVAARLERARATAARALGRAGAHLAAEDEMAAERDLRRPAREESRGGPRAREIGVAVHAAMERRLDPRRPWSAAEALHDATRDLNDRDARDATTLAGRLFEHPVVARALAARRRFVEMPLLFRDGAGDGAPLVEGKIDLLFEEPQGWVIVDWKTDRVDTDEERREKEARYVSQLEAYARGLASVLGPEARVAEKILVFARRPTDSATALSESDEPPPADGSQLRLF